MDILDRLKRKRQRRGNYDSLSIRSMKELESKMTTYLQEENIRLKDELNELRCHLKLYQDEVNSLRNNLDIAEETKNDSLIEYNKNIENTYEKRIVLLKDENKILSDMIESFRERLVQEESQPIEDEKKTESSFHSKTEQPSAAQSVKTKRVKRKHVKQQQPRWT